MVQLIQWTDIKFDFSLPVNQYPAQLERLMGTPARMEEKLKGLDRAVLTRPYKGGWSAQEHAGHLLDLEELIENRLADFESGAEVLHAADMTNKKSYDAFHNNRDINEILADFRSRRMAIVKRMLQYDEAMAGRSALHPRLQKPMRVIDLVYFSSEHDDHHLALMTRAITGN